MEQICSSVFEIHHSRCKQGMHDLVSYVQKRLEAEQEGTEEKLRKNWFSYVFQVIVLHT